MPTYTVGGLRMLLEQISFELLTSIVNVQFIDTVIRFFSNGYKGIE